MAEKKERLSTRDFHSCSSKLVCPVSLVSLLICTAALVRVEIINQRVHNVEDLVANARQNQNLIKVSTAASFKRPERVEPDGEFDPKIIEERKDVTQGNVVSSAAQLVHNLFVIINYKCVHLLPSVCIRLLTFMEYFFNRDFEKVLVLKLYYYKLMILIYCKEKVFACFITFGLE